MTPFLLVAALLAAPAAPAKAPPKPPPAPAPAKEEGDAAKAKEQFQWAQRLYKQARYAEAIAKFEEAYAARPHPVIYFNIGKCWEQLGETAKAMRAYKDYLRLAPDAKDKETVTDAVANLERRLKEKGLQQVLVYADPTSARIEVDGKDLGTAPASIELVAGNHKLSVKLDGYEAVDRSFVVQAGRSTEMTINLRPSKDTPPLPPPPPPPLVDAPKSDLKQPAKTASLTPKEPSGTRLPEVVQPAAPRKGRLWTYVAGGAAVASLGAGIGFGLAANGQRDALMKPDPTRTREQATALANGATGMGTGANVLYGVAGAAAITAVVLFFVEGR